MRARRDVVEESAPFVVVDDEHGLVPAGSRRHGVEHLRQEGVPGADVGQRVIVGRGAGAFADELRVEVGHVGECAGGGVAQELADTGRRWTVYFGPPAER